MEAAAVSAQWEAISSANTVSEHVAELNKHLAANVYVAGHESTPLDSKIFTQVTPLASKWVESKDTVAQFRHVLRWYDLVQNTTEQADKLVIDLDTEMPREIKEKPKKAPAAAAAPAKKDAKKEAAPAAAATSAAPKKKGPPSTPEEIAAAKAAKEAKKAAKAAANAAKAAEESAAAALPPSPSVVDLRVGFIQKAVKHPDADSLYVSTIDVGDEEGPRTICSGLVNYVPLEDMQERYVVIVANLKPVSMRGIKSCGMVLCASKKEDGVVEFVNPPAGSQPGDKIYFEGHEGTPDKQLNPKKKLWEQIQPHFTTLEDFTVVYQQEGKPDAKLVTKNGVCKNSTIVGAVVN